MEPAAAAPGSDQRSRPAAPGGSYVPPILDRIPPLGLIAALAAVLDLLLRRGLLRTISGGLTRSESLLYGRVFDVPLNLSAIAGLVALAIGIYTLVSARLIPPWEPSSTLERLGGGLMRAFTAGLAGVFLPSLFIATFFPMERTSGVAVFATAAVAYVLALGLASIGARFPGPLTLRFAVGLAATSAFAGAAGLVLGDLGHGLGWSRAPEIHRVVAGIGEASFLILPVLVLPRVISANPTRSTAIGAVVGTTLALLAMLFFEVWRTYVGQDFSALLYGALRVELFLDSAGMLYAAPLALYAGIGIGALCSDRPVARQLGAALLLLLAAGYGPRSPAQLAMMVLGVTLLCRATIAIGLSERYATRA